MVRLRGLLISLWLVGWCGGDGSSQVNSSVLYKCLGRVVDTGEEGVEVPGGFMSDGGVGRFRLERRELNCRKGRFKVLLEVKSGNSIGGVGKVLKLDSKSRKTNVYEDDGIRIVGGSGYLRVGSDYFSPLEYCFDQIDASELSLFVCFPECYSQRPCVKKCCGQDSVWDVWNKRCRKYDGVSEYNGTRGGNGTFDLDVKNGSGVGVAKMWEPFLFSKSVDNCVKRVTAYHREQISVHFREGMPSCGEGSSDYVVVPLRKIHDHAFQRFRVLWTGGVILREKTGNWSQFAEGRYCVDGMVNFDFESRGGYRGGFEDQVVIACKDAISPSVQKKPIPLKYALMLLVAAVILLVTALISCLLWDKQNVYEWTVSLEVISMFFLILFVGVAHTVARRPEKSDFGSPHCVFIGAAAHFFWLATFFWLFIINFEIWWHFRSLVQLRESRRWFRFTIYQLVGWGCPLLVVCFGLFLDRTWGLQNEDLDCTNVIPPNYGQLNCYISKQAQGPYIFFPIGVILAFNLVFYALTVCKMWGYQKKSSLVIQYRSKSQSNQIFIFAKLFIVMGVSWVFELVSWIITPSDADKIPLYWVIFDLVTLFQAVSIFVLFVWKKEVLSRLWWKFPRGKVLLSPFLKLPGCSLIPNERERVASIHHHMQQQVNKNPREFRGMGGVVQQPVVESELSAI